MTDGQPTPPGPLTDTQQTRIEFAHRDLDNARAADLVQLPRAELILLIERLRSRLGDTHSVVAEITTPPNSRA